MFRDPALMPITGVITHSEHIPRPVKENSKSLAAILALFTPSSFANSDTWRSVKHLCEFPPPY